MRDDVRRIARDGARRDAACGRPQKYIDVVFLIEGEEWIGFLPKWDAKGEKEAYPERDLYFFEGAEDETKVFMLPGRFAVFIRPTCTVLSARARRA